MSELIASAATSAPAPVATAAAPAPEPASGPWREAGRRLARNKLALASAIYLVIIVLLAAIGPTLMSFSNEETDLILGASPPSALHWLGTDDLGRDVLTRILYGARISLAVALAATFASVVIGVAYGAISGWLGGRVDAVMMRLVDILYVLPFTIVVILMMVLIGRSALNLFFALGAVQWLVMARVVRSQVLAIKQQEFVLAARSLGLTGWTILWRHVVPNTIGPVVVMVTLTIPSVILDEAFVSFLGLGIQAPLASWGTLIADGVGAMEIYPWMILYPCLTLVTTLLSLNFLGDGLRDALDPKAAKE